MADEDKYLNATVIPKSDPEFAECALPPVHLQPAGHALL